jgi:hypothetical protein
MAPDDLGHGVQVEGGEVGGDHHARQAHDHAHLPTVHAHSYRERGTIESSVNGLDIFLLSLLTGGGGLEGEEGQIIQRRESQMLYNRLTTLWFGVLVTL